MKTCVLTIIVSGIFLLSTLAGCTPAAAPSINIESAWGRPSPSIAGSGAIYMVIKNTGSQPDKLLAAKTSACGMAEIHETVKNADGTMSMNLLTDPVDLPAGSQVEFKSGSFHIMCMMMKTDQFKTGAKIELTLTFEKSGEKKVGVEIRE
jgi:copper(I)-binding protein